MSVNPGSPPLQNSGKVSTRAPDLALLLDGVRLRTQLEAIALDCIGRELEARQRAVKLLHGALFRGRLIAQEWLEAGGSGYETARLLSDVQDEVLRAMYFFATQHVFRSRTPTHGERFAIIAVGGYGRGELGPSSDIDLLFLRSYKETPYSESMIEFLLYMLWDLGLKVGHASRNHEECIRLSRDDMTIRTTLLESRWLAGDRPLFDTLQRRFWNEIVPGTSQAFIAAKLSEREARIRSAGQSRFLVEPQVKIGKGGLRDLHTLLWIAAYLRRTRVLGELVGKGVFTAEESEIFVHAREFLWRVRCHLHFLTGRAEERLSFDLQPEMAKRLGFMAANGEPDVEGFMRAYFGVARSVGALTRILCAKLEAEEQKRQPLSLSRWFEPRPKPVISDIAEFRSDSGRLNFQDEKAVERDPTLMFLLFEEADRIDADIHPAALALISRRLDLINDDIRKNECAIASFLAVATSTNAPASALRLMNESGLLGAFLPEFGAIVARTQFNMYHSYTVDEHSLNAVQTISDIEQSKFEEDHPLASAIIHKVQNRRALYLAMLLHDTGKTGSDQEAEGAKSAQIACARLGLGEDETALIAWLVGHHLRMSECAQRRDLADPRTITQFAALVGTPERLRLLLILTVADMRAVGPGIFNSWKGQLLRDLYCLTEAALRGARADESAIAARLTAQAQERRAELETSLLAAPSKGKKRRSVPIPQILHSLEDSYWLSFPLESHIWHCEQLSSLNMGAEPHSPDLVAFRDRPQEAVSEIMVRTLDRPGLFADLCAVFANAGASVARASIYTSAQGLAFDVFAIQTLSGQCFGLDDPLRMQRLAEELALAIAGKPPEFRPMPRANRRESAFLIEPYVAFDLEASHSSTLVEMSGRDRPGLLYELAKVIAQAGFALRSAHIGAFGNVVSDVFYLVDANGAKISDPDALEALKAQLLQVLSQNEPEAPHNAARKPLAQAKASLAR